MKGECVKEEKDNHTSMFAKFHQAQKFQHHPSLPQQPTTLHHHSFHVTAANANPRECQTSDEVDSHRSPTAPSTTSTKRDVPTQIVHLPAAAHSSGNDGASIEVVRRPRGRPPGSKNKPKAPVIITRDSEPSMSPYVLELPGGIDIVESITSFCGKRSMGLCILNGSGTVTNVTLRQPSTTPGASVTFHGRFDILSLSATVIPPNAYTLSSMSNGVANGFTISLAGPQGQVVGGAVLGSLFSAGTVYLIAASFNNPSFHRLPLEDERNSGSASGGNEGLRQSSPAVSGGGDSGQSPPTAAAAAVESCGVSLYSCHFPSDVIWAPSGRQPPHHPPPY